MLQERRACAVKDGHRAGCAFSERDPRSRNAIAIDHCAPGCPLRKPIVPT